MDKITKEKLAEALEKALNPKKEEPEPFPWMVVIIGCAIAGMVIIANLPSKQPAPLPSSGSIGNPK